MATKFRSLDDLPLVLRVEDLMPVLDIGRNTAYELIRCGQIRSVKVGRQIRVPKEAVAEFLTGRTG
ncbi:MAG: helix-turn-helix domain-containing protein [Oscillibacter sp.]|nr:helix-turn-helix domain-containing protein [Oscillibacter sp.]